MPKKRPPRPKVVKEPVQVYLTRQDRVLLDRVAAKSRLSRAEVLRRGLKRFGAEVLVDENPVVKFLGEMSRADWPVDMPTDVARRHDEYLADSYLDRHEDRRT